MKKFYLSSVLAFITALSGYAQAPSITTANNFAIGESTIQYLADTTNIVSGAGGANVTWDFTGLQQISTKDSAVSKFQTVASTPYPNDFPTAQLATGSLSGNAYLYLSYQNSTYTIVGEEGQQTVNGQTVTIKQVYDKPEVLYTFPLTYQTHQNSTYSAYYDFQGDTVYRIGNLNVTGDGYGTVKIMNKTYNNVLRIHAITNETDSETVQGITFTYTLLTESWSYLTPGIKDNILTIMLTTINQGGFAQTTKSVNYNINHSSLGVNGPKTDNYNVRLYPNPAKQNCRLSIASKTDGRSDIQIVNQLGQTVKSLNNMALRTGENNFDLDLTGLPNGIYYVRINAGNESQVKKLVIE